ncbi:hypothetical protein GCK32_005729, partial [Trichostrongylus colubriformis]
DQTVRAGGEPWRREKGAIFTSIQGSTCPKKEWTSLNVEPKHYMNIQTHGMVWLEVAEKEIRGLQKSSESVRVSRFKVQAALCFSSTCTRANDRSQWLHLK